MISQISGNVTSWKYRLSTNATHDPAYEKWIIRRKPKNRVLRVTHCLHFHLNSVLLSQTELYILFFRIQRRVESVPGSFVETILYSGSLLSPSHLLLSYRMFSGEASKPILIPFIQHDCYKVIHFLSVFDQNEQWVIVVILYKVECLCCFWIQCDYNEPGYASFYQ